MIKSFFLPFLLWSFFSFCEAPIFHVYYTCKEDPSESMQLNVQTSDLKELTIELRQNGQLICKKHSIGTYFSLPEQSRYLHHVNFQSLDPNTQYVISIKSEDISLKESKFKTLSKNLNEITFLIGGDLEIIHEADKILYQMAQCEPDIILFGGDYPKDVYSLNDYKKWDDWLTKTTSTLIKKDGCQIPWVMAIGNNEVFGSFYQPIENAPFFHAYFPQSDNGQHYFDLTIASSLHLLVLDSGLTAFHDGEQKVWLKEKVAFKNKPNLKMALYHVPIYPSVRFKEKNWYYRLAHAVSRLKKQKNIASRLLSKPSMDGYVHWAPLFDEHQIKVAFEHHEHTFKRTHPIKAGKVNFQNGTLYLGDGALAPFPRYSAIQKFIDFRLKKSISHVQFFWLMTFNDDLIHFKAITSYGKPIDQFSIKGSYD
jgi:hypothetical protein